jgi:hypothetical protein
VTEVLSSQRAPVNLLVTGSANATLAGQARGARKAPRPPAGDVAPCLSPDSTLVRGDKDLHAIAQGATAPALPKPPSRPRRLSVATATTVTSSNVDSALDGGGGSAASTEATLGGMRRLTLLVGPPAIPRLRGYLASVAAAVNADAAAVGGLGRTGSAQQHTRGRGAQHELLVGLEEGVLCEATAPVEAPLLAMPVLPGAPVAPTSDTLQLQQQLASPFGPHSTIRRGSEPQSRCQFHRCNWWECVPYCEGMNVDLSEGQQRR